MHPELSSRLINSTASEPHGSTLSIEQVYGIDGNVKGPIISMTACLSTDPATQLAGTVGAGSSLRLKYVLGFPMFVSSRLKVINATIVPLSARMLSVKSTVVAPWILELNGIRGMLESGPVTSGNEGSRKLPNKKKKKKKNFLRHHIFLHILLESLESAAPAPKFHLPKRQQYLLSYACSGFLRRTDMLGECALTSRKKINRPNAHHWSEA